MRILRSLACSFLLVAPAAAQGGLTQDAIDAAIERGVEFLLPRQLNDGGWAAWGGQQRTGSTALVVYTLLKSGVDPEHEAIKRAIRRMSQDEVASTYDAGCLAMALAAHDPRAHREWLAETAGLLISFQDGSWGYPGNDLDLSNTQYAALGLRAAALAGIHIPDSVWFDLAKALERYESGSGYGYRKGQHPTGSMTAAGVGTLAICDGMMTRSGALTSKQGKSFLARRGKGLEWLGEHFSVTSNPGSGAWLHYYLYGLERVGALAGVTLFGAHDWYREGAQELVTTQGRAGGWAGGGGIGDGTTQTCFALLFLNRATRPETGVKHKQAKNRRGTNDPHADLSIAATGDTPLRLWIASFGKDALESLEWPKEKGRGPRIVRVVYYADGEAISLVRGDESRPAEANRFEIEHSFRVAGTYKLQVKAHVLGPPRTNPQGRVLPGIVKVIESPTFDVEIKDVVPAWLIAQEDDYGRNLMVAANASVKASSVLNGGKYPNRSAWSAMRVVDNRMRTSWLAEPSDKRPELMIQLKRPQRADVILIGHAQRMPHEPGHFARAFEVEVLINDKHEYTMRMHYDERRKGRLVLERPMTIRSLELVIPASVPGEGSRSMGFTEVELQLKD
jgi:hypothetical protein